MLQENIRCNSSSLSFPGIMRLLRLEELLGRNYFRHTSTNYCGNDAEMKKYFGQGATRTRTQALQLRALSLTFFSFPLCRICQSYSESVAFGSYCSIQGFILMGRKMDFNLIFQYNLEKMVWMKTFSSLCGDGWLH